VSNKEPQNDAEHLALLNEVVAQPRDYPATRFAGRGIVICGGGIRYFTNAYVCIRMLRKLGCALPVELWHLDGEITDTMRDIVAPLGVLCVNASRVRERWPARILNGWELKPYAIIHSQFREVLLLDADNVPVNDPEYLFDCEPYKQTGAIFWPDYGRLGSDRLIWQVMDVPYRDEPEFESGQIVVDKSRCWKALQVTMHLNEWSDFYYRHIHGDKETFHMAWRKLDQEYSMPPYGIHSLAATMCQHDFDGNRLFQHRNMRKWSLMSSNEPIEDFKHEAACLEFLEDLRKQWHEAPRHANHPDYARWAAQIIEQRFYTYCRVGYDFRPIEFAAGGRIHGGPRDAVEHTWMFSGPADNPKLLFWHDNRVLCELSFGGQGMLHGAWREFEKMPVVLLPVDKKFQAAVARCEFRLPRLGAVEWAVPQGRAAQLVLTGASGELHEKIAALTSPRLRAYAKKHGHDFATCDMGGIRPASWYKVPALVQALQFYERVIWVDSDVIVAQDDKDIFAEVPQDAWQAVAEHNADIGTFPNCGVWLVTRAMLPVLAAIWTRDEYINHPWWEQAAIMAEMGYTTNIRRVEQPGPTTLSERTYRLDSTWNPLPPYASAPRFQHIFTNRDFPDRLQRVKDVLAELERNEA
jgi:hypothetical protein